MSRFKEGHEKKGGRAKGTPNKLTTTVKESVLNAFNQLQTDPKQNLAAFAKKYPRDFYNIAAKLIPTEMVGEVTNEILIRVEYKDDPTETTSQGTEGDIKPS